jgi:DNA mismatch repair protein MutS
MSIETDLGPLAKQYREIREDIQKQISNENVLLLYRIGDFYEIFFDEAFKVSKLTGLPLSEFKFTPMVGIPCDSVQEYIAKLVDVGYVVAVTEQVEDRTKKGWPIKREVKEIIRKN